MTRWTPPTFEDAYPDYPEGLKATCGAPDCGRAVWPFLLQDVRGIPGVDGDFLCDGCRSTLHRHRIAIDGGFQPATRAEWKTRLMQAHGAPASAIAASQAHRERDY